MEGLHSIILPEYDHLGHPDMGICSPRHRPGRVEQGPIEGYKELHELDMLLSELRWFSLELRRAEFQA